MKQKLIIGLLLIAAYFLAQWIENHARLPDSVPTASNKQPDNYYQNFSTQIINSDGITQYYFSGKKLFHYNDQHSEIDSPLIYLMEDNNWQVSANKGIIDEGKKVIYLQQNIVATNQKNTDEKIIAEELTIYPEKKILQTNKKLKLYRANSLTSANAMLANLQENKLTLYHHVITHYYEND